MNQENVIKEILADVFKISKEEMDRVQKNESLIDLGLDSIKAIEMVVRLEDYFDLMISDDDLFIEKISTIKDIMQVIDRNGGVQCKP